MSRSPAAILSIGPPVELDVGFLAKCAGRRDFRLRRLMFEIAVAVVACLVGAALSVRLSFFALVPALSVVLVLVALGEV